MKKLLIKVFCGITVFALFMFAGCNNSTSEETSQEMSNVKTEEEATTKAVPDKDILLSAPPLLESPIDSTKEKKEVSKVEESSVVESSIEESSEETESLVEDTEESYETEDETNEVEYYYEEEYIYEEEDYEDYATEDNYIETYEDEYIVEDTVFQSDYDALYTPADFQNMGIINWGGWCWTFYSQRAMPGEGLIIPGRHVDCNGYVCDENDYICLASSSLDKGTVVDTPFGKMGKVYDCGCLNYILDVYVDWAIY